MSEATPNSEPLVAGILYACVASDWGDEVDLERARQLAPAEVRSLPRRPRTPTSIAYRPPPLRFALPGDGSPPAECDATVFDFAAVRVYPETTLPFAGVFAGSGIPGGARRGRARGG